MPGRAHALIVEVCAAQGRSGCSDAPSAGGGQQLGYQVGGDGRIATLAIQRAEELRPHDRGGAPSLIYDVPVVPLTAFSEATAVQRATAMQPFG